MEPKIALDLIDYIGILSRLQSFQILGFFLACTSLVIAISSLGMRRMLFSDRFLLYLTAVLIFISFATGLFPDLKSLLLKYSLKDDLSGVLAVSQDLFFIYLVQIALAIAAISCASLLRMRLKKVRPQPH